MPAQAIFLDRDGTLIVNRHYLSDPAGVELLPGVREALHGMLHDGSRLFLFTNQSGVGRGMFSMEDVHRCHERMLELLGLPEPGFANICIAPEAPDAPSVYRKPSPRFIVEMIARYRLEPASVWMVGDSPQDVQAGINAGVRAALLQEAPASPWPPGVWICRDLSDFVARLRSSISRPAQEQ